jgi:hypothetical protein
MKTKNHLVTTQGLVFIALLMLIILTRCGVTKKEFVSGDLKERDGLGNVFYKLKDRDTLRIAYLGGSITAQSGWRVYSREWFKENYPETETVEINAAIGGTGSPFGVYRLREHALQYDPDLVFVEFAVNDANTEPEKIIQSMEGIVRQVWEQDPATDICFIYTIKEDFIDTYERDSLPVSVVTMEKVADHYQIPSINFGPEVLRRVKSGKLLFKGGKSENDTVEVFSPDGVHPYPDSGHKIYADVFAGALGQMKTTSVHAIHKMGNALNPDLLNDAKMISWTAVNSGGELESIEIGDDPALKGFSRYFESVGKGEPGDSISFQFKGKSIGFYDVIGPGTGTVLVTVDGAEHTFTRFDKYSTYRRIGFTTIEGLTDALHTVSFKVLDKPIDKKEILSGNNKVMENEKDYTELNWYLARVMVNGDLIANK